MSHPVRDQDSTIHHGRGAYGWESALALPPEKRILNPENWAFFGLLTGFEEIGWQLHNDKEMAKDGRLYRIPSVHSGELKMRDEYWEEDEDGLPMELELGARDGCYETNVTKGWPGC